MAKKKEEKKLERTYNIPLRKEWLKVPRYKRSQKAVKAVKEFLAKHMKTDKVKLGKHLNLDIWKHGIKNPPHHIKVNVIKDSDGVAKAELVGFEYKEEKKPAKKEKKGKAEQIKEKLMGKQKEVKEEKKKEVKATELEKAVGGAEEKEVKAQEGKPSVSRKGTAEELVEEQKKDVKEDAK